MNLQSKGKNKERAADKTFIPIPSTNGLDPDDDALSDEDLAFFAEHGLNTGGFLTNLDEKAIGRYVHLFL